LIDIILKIQIFACGDEKKPLNTSNLTSDAWLSGFIEADGHFSVRTTKMINLQE